MDAAYQFEKLVNDMYEKRNVTVGDLCETANELDKIRRDCRKACAAGKSAKITGGILTAIGVVCSVFSLGAAAPVAVAGLAVGGAGAATELGTHIIEGFLNSSKIKKVEGRKCNLITSIKAVEDVATSWLNGSKEYLQLVHDVAQNALGPGHQAVSLINKVLQVAGSNMGSVKGSIFNFSQKLGVSALEWGSQFVKGGGQAAARAGAASAEAIVGASTFFVVFDTFSLGFTIRDIVQKKGSDAANELRERANKLRNM